MITAVRPQAIVGSSSQIDSRRAQWVSAYRQKSPAADIWAQGLRHLHHSIETQERVFRMAQQLARVGIPPADLFLRLEEADRSVAVSQDPQDAASAGHRAVSSLLPLADKAVVICADRLGPDLSAFGFDPIPFDAHDPAAYAWVMFELTMRAHAD